MKILERRFLSSTTRSVHAASIAFFKGHPVFSFFGGSREGAPDTAIYINNLNNDDKNIIIGNNDGIPRWNPILMPLDNKLFLFEKAGIFVDRWQTILHNITNWSNDIHYREIANTSNILPAGLNGPVKTKPIVIDKYIYCGSSVETIFDWSSFIEAFYYSSGNFSFDNRSNPLFVPEKKIYIDYNGIPRATLGVIQPSIWNDTKENKLKAFMRSSRGLGKIYYSEHSGLSDPHSNVWEKPIATNLDNPNSGIDTVYYKDKLYLVYNPSEENRSPLVISQVEQDLNNRSIFNIVDTLIIKEKVEESDNTMVISPELSYPYLIENDGLLHCVYTYGRTRIEHVIISL